MIPAAAPATPPSAPFIPPPLAPLDARVKAYLIDSVLSATLGLPLLGAHVWATVGSVRTGASAAELALAATVLLVNPVLGVLLSAVLYVVVPTRMRGMTVGKRVMCIRVTRDDCREATWRDHALRFVALYVDAIAVVAPGLVLVSTRADRKRLGDMVARTVVVVSQ